MQVELKENQFDRLLHDIYEDQQRIIRTWGITIPPDAEIFRAGCPLEAKVMFFDWLIREGLTA